MSDRSRRARTRRGIQWPAVVWLTLVWVLLWGDISWLIVIGGVVVALVVLIVFPLPPLAFTGRIHPRALATLVGRFLWDLVRASVHVAALAMRFGHEPRNAVIAVPLASRGDLYMLLTAELVSLVPGSLLLETSYDDHILYLHILDAPTPEAVERARSDAKAQEERVVLALASEEEIREYRARRREST